MKAGAWFILGQDKSIGSKLRGKRQPFAGVIQVPFRRNMLFYSLKFPAASARIPEGQGTTYGNCAFGPPSLSHPTRIKLDCPSSRVAMFNCARFFTAQIHWVIGKWHLNSSPLYDDQAVSPHMGLCPLQEGAPYELVFRTT